MNTQVCIDALRDIEQGLDQARNANDRKTLEWIATVVEEVELRARSIRKQAQQAVRQLADSTEAEKGRRVRP